MPTFILPIVLAAPIERCFDLARSIDFHCESMKHTGEQAIAGVTTGLVEAGQTVTWRARHLGLTRELTSKVTRCERPGLFVDEMVAGAFRSFRHEHCFEVITPGVTRLTDRFEFESPLGPVGRAVNTLYLTGYMRGLLLGHQQRLEHALETEAWRRFLPGGR